MDTIDFNVMQAASEGLHDYQAKGGMRYIHTVTIELNGAHGGADLIIKGFTGTDVSLCNEVTIKTRLP